MFPLKRSFYLYAIGVVFSALIANAAYAHPVIVHFEKALKQWKAIQCGDAGCSSGNGETNLFAPWLDIPSSAMEQRSFQVGTDGKPGLFIWNRNEQQYQWLKCGNATCTSGNTVTPIAGVPAGGEPATYYRNVVGAAMQGNNPVVFYPLYGPIPGSPGSTGHYQNMSMCTTPGCSGSITTTPNLPAWTQMSATLGNDGLPIIAFAGSSTLSVLHCGNAACTAGNVVTQLHVDPGSDVYGQQIAVNRASAAATPIITSVWSGTLKVTKCSNHACTSSVTNEIETAPWISLDGDITYGSDGLPMLSYYKQESNCPIFPECIDDPPTVVMEGLRVLHCGTQDCATPATNTFNWIDAVNNAGGLQLPAIGSASSIIIDPTDGKPTIAYQALENLQATAADLRVVHCSNNTCSGPQNISTVIANGNPGYNVDMVYVTSTGGGTGPAAPTGVTATAMSTSQINVTWNASSGATSYKIYQDSTCSSLLQNLGNVTSFTHSSLLPGTTYSYSLKASNASGDSSCSAPASATTLTNPPATPTGLTATPISTSQINLAWNTVSGATSYKLFHNTTCVGTPLYQGATASYPHTGLLPASVHSYSVKASNAGGDSGCSTPASTTTFPNAPSAPLNLTAAAISTTQINITWDGVAGATSYKLYANAACSGSTLYQGTIAAFPHTGLTAGSTHTYAVKASNAGGDSPCSLSATATTFNNPPGAPGNLTATAVSVSEIDLSWNTVSGATGYKLFEAGNCNGTPIFQGTATSFPHTGLAAASTHTYGVKAINAGGDSPCSAPATATTFSNPPSTPTGLTATAVSSSQIDLAWNAVADATGYKLFHDAICNNLLIQLGTVTAHSHTGLLPNTVHRYSVKAINAGGESGCSTGALATTFPAPPAVPGTPSNVHAEAMSPHRIEVTWDIAADAVSYQIFRGANCDTLIDEMAANDFMDSNLDEETTYVYTLRAVNAVGSSACSASASAETFGVSADPISEPNDPAHPGAGTGEGQITSSTGCGTLGANAAGDSAALFLLGCTMTLVWGLRRATSYRR